MQTSASAFFSSLFEEVFPVFAGNLSVLSSAIQERAVAVFYQPPMHLVGQADVGAGVTADLMNPAGGCPGRINWRRPDGSGGEMRIAVGARRPSRHRSAFLASVVRRTNAAASLKRGIRQSRHRLSSLRRR